MQTCKTKLQPKTFQNPYFYDQLSVLFNKFRKFNIMNKYKKYFIKSRKKQRNLNFRNMFRLAIQFEKKQRIKRVAKISTEQINNKELPAYILDFANHIFMLLLSSIIYIFNLLSTNFFLISICPTTKKYFF